MNRQKNTKTKILVQKLIDDRSKAGFFYKYGRWDFHKYQNEEIFEYLDIDYDQLIEILEDLKNLGVIFQYECLETEENEKKSKKEGLEGYRITGFRSHEAPSYEECSIKLPDDFLKKAQAYLAGKTSQDEKKSSDKIILHLDKSGNLWYGDDKSKNCYSMKTDGQVFFIFKYLVDNSGIQPTKDIARAVSNAFSITKTSRQVSVDIGRIKRKISGNIKVIEGGDLIPKNKNGDGYQISSRFQIIEI